MIACAVYGRRRLVHASWRGRYRWSMSVILYCRCDLHLAASLRSLKEGITVGGEEEEEEARVGCESRACIPVCAYLDGKGGCRADQMYRTEMHVCGLQKMVVRITAFGGSVIQGAYGMVDRSSSSRSRAELKNLT